MDNGMVGKRIADYRQRAGMTQQELAGEAGMERSALAKVETGNRRVGVAELAAVAAALGVRMEWFLQPAPDDVVAYRSALAPDAPTSSIDQLIEHVARSVDFVSENRPQKIAALAGGERTLRSRDDAEEFAKVVRATLALKGAEPVADLGESAAAIGALIFVQDLGTDAPEGASVVSRHCGVAVVNGALKVGRRRLAAAHELGHLLTRDGYRVDWRIEAPDQNEAEMRLDQFARALLLPEKAVIDAIECDRDGGMREKAIRLASEYQVDMATVARRLHELDLVSKSDEAMVRAVRTTAADIVELNLVIRRDLEPPFAPRIYQKLVLDLYRSESVTASRALDLLAGTFSYTDLPERPSVPEAVTWQAL